MYKTYFIRHSSALDIDGNTLTLLWNNDFVGIHYPYDKTKRANGADSQSLDPNDYEKFAKSTLARLKKIGKEGGYVFASYRNIKGGKIGFIEPCTEVEVFHGKWGKGKYVGENAKLKVLKMKNVRNLDAFEGLSLTSVQPRQGTLCHWSKVGSRVQNLVEGVISNDVGSLTTHLQEVMCMEFMRTNRAVELELPQILYTLMPVGRTMKDLDILAIDKNSKPISVQVTYYEQNSIHAQKKLEVLDKYKDGDSHTVFFCRCEKKEVKNGHIVFPLEQVFNEFCLNSDLGKRWYDMVTGK
jgi:hypothetical protein